MRAILIDPVEKTITEVEYTGDYKNIYEHIKADLFTTVEIKENESLFIDDEGFLLEPHLPLFALKGYHQYLPGYGLILGLDEEGKSVATKLTLEEVKDMVSFHPEVELSHFEDISGTTTMFGMEMPMIGHRAVFKRKDAE